MAAESAAANWASHLAGNVTLAVQVNVCDLPGNQLAWCSSVETVEHDGLFEPQAAFKLRTGQDPFGDAPDIYVKVDAAKIAAGESDPVEILTHELLHGLGFDGWGEGGAYQTPFGSLIRNGAFTGSAAQAIHGGPVPLAPALTSNPASCNQDRIISMTESDPKNSPSSPTSGSPSGSNSAPSGRHPRNSR